MLILHRIFVTKIVPLFLSDSTISIQLPHFQLKSVDFLAFQSDLASMDTSMLPLTTLAAAQMIVQAL